MGDDLASELYAKADPATILQPKSGDAENSKLLKFKE